LVNHNQYVEILAAVIKTLFLAYQQLVEGAFPFESAPRYLIMRSGSSDRFGRECLNHASVINHHHLKRIFRDYFDYYHQSRTHISLAKDLPESRGVEFPESVEIVKFPKVGGMLGKRGTSQT